MIIICDVWLNIEISIETDGEFAKYDIIRNY
jgi:hypothetical protein